MQATATVTAAGADVIIPSDSSAAHSCLHGAGGRASQAGSLWIASLSSGASFLVQESNMDKVKQANGAINATLTSVAES
jgi:hypothetical protein